MLTDRPRPAEGVDPSVSRAPIQLNLTAAGWAVIALVVASGFIASASRIAVGFLIPAVAATVIDVLASWYFLNERVVSITPSRTVAHLPDGIPLRVRATGPARPLRVSITFRGGVEQTFSLTDEPVTTYLPASRTGVISYLRCSTSCTIFGLGVARRWQTHSVSMLHWAPAPRPVRLTTPTAVDEVARLRTYVPGDRMSRVSWPITARTGQMYVRAAGDGYEEFVVVLNLGRRSEHTASTRPAPPPIIDESELATTLELGATLIAQLLEDGHQVRLVTSELNEQAHDDLRQVAMLNPRLPAVLAAGTRMELQVVDRYVTDEDDLARRLARAEPTSDMTWPYGSWVDVSSAGVRTLP